MKKALYIILLVVELILGVIVLGYTTILSGATALLLVFALWAVLAVWILAKLKKAEDGGRKRKLKCALALVTLIPLVAGVAAFMIIVALYF